MKYKGKNTQMKIQGGCFNSWACWAVLCFIHVWQGGCAWRQNPLTTYFHLLCSSWLKKRSQWLLLGCGGCVDSTLWSLVVQDDHDYNYQVEGDHDYIGVCLILCEVWRGWSFKMDDNRDVMTDGWMIMMMTMMMMTTLVCACFCGRCVGVDRSINEPRPSWSLMDLNTAQHAQIQRLARIQIKLNYKYK